MTKTIVRLFEKGGGEFITPPSSFIKKLKNVKAIIFDWDGVFNSGVKKLEEGSLFSEVDAMGTNLLRYAYWKLDKQIPKSAIITGDTNPSALAFAKRENFDEVYVGAKDKMVAFGEFTTKYKLKPEEVLFFFDDVLDLEVARNCGARIMIRRKANPLMNKFVEKGSMADYLTANDGGNLGLREGCELVMGLLGLYEQVVSDRMKFKGDYEKYWQKRQRGGLR